MHKRSKNHKKKSEWFYVRGHRTKKERKKYKRARKERRARNKRLIAHYPFLGNVLNWRGYPVKNSDFDLIALWDEVPEGWTNIFGRLMCDEIMNALNTPSEASEITFEQCKEKYGGMRVYAAAPESIQRILSIYERISENICCRCGKPHSPMMNFSWISPYCEDCFHKLQRKNKNFYQGEYTKYAPENKEEWNIPTILRWKKFSKEGDQIIEIDISSRIKAIEQRWEKIEAKKKKDKERKERRKNGIPAEVKEETI